MAHNITTAPNLETLTEAGLFRRYLDTEVRVGATTSALVDDDGTIHSTTARDLFFYHNLEYVGCDLVVCDFAEGILHALENDEAPICEMEKHIERLSGVLEGLKAMALDFARLASVTRVAQPEETGDEDVDSAAYDEWNANPRYVLPVSALSCSGK